MQALRAMRFLKLARAALLAASFWFGVACPAPAADTDLTPGEQALAQNLADTYWAWPNYGPGKGDAYRWFRLNADGTVTAGWNTKSHHWKPTGDLTIEFDVTETNTLHQLLFNPGLTSAKLTGEAPKGGSINLESVFFRLAGPNRATPFVASAAVQQPPVPGCATARGRATTGGALPAHARRGPGASPAWAFHG